MFGATLVTEAGVGEAGLSGPPAIAVHDHADVRRQLITACESLAKTARIERDGRLLTVTVFLITGIQAAGKSTVAQAPAERFDRSVHVRGDLFRRMVIKGRVEMGPAHPSDEAIRQLRLRYGLAASVADGYARAGFTVVVQDIVLGTDLTDMITTIRTRPCYVVVLAPRAEVVQRRDEARQAVRGKVAYRPGDETVADLDDYLRNHTPKVGLWLDTSELTVAETVEEIFRRAASEAAV